MLAHLLSRYELINSLQVDLGANVMVLKFARAGGARIIATTSSDEKARRLKELGASHVLNYKENPNWGGFARSLTPNEEGVDVVVEVGGPASARQVRLPRSFTILSLKSKS